MKYSEITKFKIVETLSTISLGFLVLGLVLNEESYPNWVLLIVLFSLISGLFVPFLSKPVTWLWFKLSDVLGFVMSKIVLGTLFYVFISPLALFFRLFNSDNLGLRKTKESFFEIRDYNYNKNDLENPW
tara:strand:- start:1613 stop:1999 length:387 start_codon:yes stop_codon:yes gene_type:complete